MIKHDIIAHTSITKIIKLSDPIQITNVFCNYFTNIGENFANKLPDPKKQSYEYLKQIKTQINKAFSCVPQMLVKATKLKIIFTLKTALVIAILAHTLLN